MRTYGIKKTKMDTDLQELVGRTIKGDLWSLLHVEWDRAKR